MNHNDHLVILLNQIPIQEDAFSSLVSSGLLLVSFLLSCFLSLSFRLSPLLLFSLLLVSLLIFRSLSPFFSFLSFFFLSASALSASFDQEQLLCLGDFGSDQVLLLDRLSDTERDFALVTLT